MVSKMFQFNVAMWRRLFSSMITIVTKQTEKTTECSSVSQLSDSSGSAKLGHETSATIASSEKSSNVCASRTPDDEDIAKGVIEYTSEAVGSAPNDVECDEANKHSLTAKVDEKQECLSDISGNKSVHDVIKLEEKNKLVALQASDVIAEELSKSVKDQDKHTVVVQRTEKTFNEISQNQSDEAILGENSADVQASGKEVLAENDLNESAEGPILSFADLDDYEDQVNAMFGGLKEDECTYSLGAMTRQPLYACLTCLKDKENPAAVCYACSLSCHDDHELVEMYTKRNFTCDCGNAKFVQQCKLKPDKKPFNRGNIYDKTFMGKYCHCNRPFPDDAQDACPDDMVQCIVCEDWFHMTHLKLHPNDKDKTDSDFGEMICDGCMSDSARELMCYYETLGAFSDKDSTPTGNESLGTNSITEKCTRPKVSERFDQSEPFATLWKNEWRKHLCKCEQCLNSLQLNGILFVTDWDDSMTEYERKAIEAEKSETEAKMARIPYVQKQMFGQFMNIFGKTFADFLKSFPPGTVIKAQDVSLFTEKMKENMSKDVLDKMLPPPDHCR